MNSTPNATSQGCGSMAEEQPKPLRGSKERMITAIIQLVCGVIAVCCGVVLVALRNPFASDPFSRYRIIEKLGNTAFGIWGGVVFIATAIPYLSGRNKKCVVALYFGFCLASTVIATLGLGLSLAAINKIVSLKSYSTRCTDLYGRIDNTGEYQCCFYRYYNRYECDDNYFYDSYNYYFYDSYNYYFRRTRSPLGMYDYDSQECELQRKLSRSKVEECFQEMKGAYVAHLAFHGILIAVVSVELFASVYGACAALSAFCKCCAGERPTPWYTCSFNQLMINDSLNNMTYPPPVTNQPTEPAVISTTQVPQIFP